MQNTETIFKYIEEKLEEADFSYNPVESGQPWITVSPDSIQVVATFLRDDSELLFDTLMCLSGVHYPKEEMVGVTYHLHSTKYAHSLALKVKVPVNEPRIPSVEPVWKTADWHEREAWDMYGIIFENHPNLTRILCPEDWEGHPLRKDYERQDNYKGLTTRS